MANSRGYALWGSTVVDWGWIAEFNRCATVTPVDCVGRCYPPIWNICKGEG